MTSKEILVVGELNVDLILDGMTDLPEIGTEIIADKMTLTLGSSSAIMAANIASLGTSACFCGKVGDDYFGDFILDALQSKGLDTTFIKKSASYKTGATVVMNYGQERANVTFGGAMDFLTIDDIPWDRLHQFRHLHLSNFFMQKGLKNDIAALFKKAKTYGVTTSLDIQWDPSNAWEFDYKACLPDVDVFMPNEAELLALTNSTSVAQGLEKIRSFAEIIALKLGEKGSIGISGDEQLEVPAFNTQHFVDAIGAGDSFNAGFINRYLQNASLEECLKYGNAVGALSTMAAGGTGAFANTATINERVSSLLKSVQNT